MLWVFRAGEPLTERARGATPMNWNGRRDPRKPIDRSSIFWPHGRTEAPVPRQISEIGKRRSGQETKVSCIGVSLSLRSWRIVRDSLLLLFVLTHGGRHAARGARSGNGRHKKQDVSFAGTRRGKDIPNGAYHPMCPRAVVSSFAG
jgi:hypothetical protein